MPADAQTTRWPLCPALCILAAEHMGQSYVLFSYKYVYRSARPKSRWFDFRAQAEVLGDFMLDETSRCRGSGRHIDDGELLTGTASGTGARAPLSWLLHSTRTGASLLFPTFIELGSELVLKH